MDKSDKRFPQTDGATRFRCAEAKGGVSCEPAWCGDSGRCPTDLRLTAADDAEIVATLQECMLFVPDTALKGSLVPRIRRLIAKHADGVTTSNVKTEATKASLPIEPVKEKT
jgi:hypothetical protein